MTPHDWLIVLAVLAPVVVFLLVTYATREFRK